MSDAVSQEQGAFPPPAAPPARSSSTCRAWARSWTSDGVYGRVQVSGSSASAVIAGGVLDAEHAGVEDNVLDAGVLNLSLDY